MVRNESYKHKEIEALGLKKEEFDIYSSSKPLLNQENKSININIL